MFFAGIRATIPSKMESSHVSLTRASQGFKESETRSAAISPRVIGGTIERVGQVVVVFDRSWWVVGFSGDNCFFFCRERDTASRRYAMVLPAARNFSHRLHAFGRSLSDDFNHGSWRQCKESAWTFCLTTAIRWAIRRFTSPSFRGQSLLTRRSSQSISGHAVCLPPSWFARLFVTSTCIQLNDLRTS